MELALELDEKAQESINDLMSYYGVSRAKIVSKALAILKMAAYIEQTQGELLARKGNHETKLLIR